MDRRQFLVGVARTGLAAGLLAIVDACAGPTQTNLLGVLGNRPASAPPSPPSSARPSAPPGQGPVQPSRDNPIVAENRLRGERGWDPNAMIGPSVASAFAASASVAPGDALDLHVACPTAFDVDWYRLGWYDGSGGRLVRRDRGLEIGRASCRERV